MYRSNTIFRFQLALTVSALGLGLFYLVVFRPLSQRVVRLNEALQGSSTRAGIWDRLVKVNLQTRSKVGLTLDAVSASQVLAERAVATLQKVAEETKGRVELEAEYRERLRQPMQVLDFDQQRSQLIKELRVLAAGRNVNLGPAVTDGYPTSDFLAGEARTSLVWAQLAMVHYVLMTAANYGPATIKSASLLPIQTRISLEPNRVSVREFPVRIELTGSMEAALNFLVSLPLQVEELKRLNYPFVSAYKPALFIDRLILKGVPGSPNDVSLEAVITGFLWFERTS